MKIPFTLEAWLKDKSQRVETRDGRVVHNIWRVKEPSYTNNRKMEVCALIDGEEDALVFFEGGRYLPTTKDTDSPFDLFIVTPEPELSEFEKGCIRLYQDGRDDGFAGDNLSDENLKECSAELLALARKELIKEGTSKNEMGTMLYDAGFEDGKAEALKDLPRWNESRGVHRDGWINDGFLYYKNHSIQLSSLEKLPGFKED